MLPHCRAAVPATIAALHYHAHITTHDGSTTALPVFAALPRLSSRPPPPSPCFVYLPLLFLLLSFFS